VRRENDRLLFADLLDDLANLDDLVRIEATGGLVENQHLGLVQDGLRESDALLESLRQLANQKAKPVAEAALLNHLAFRRRVRFDPDGSLRTSAMKLRYSRTVMSRYSGVPSGR
jgi:hypothetical protein